MTSTLESRIYTPNPFPAGATFLMRGLPIGCPMNIFSRRIADSRSLEAAKEAMKRPTLEVADIVRASGNRFWEHYRLHLTWKLRKVLDAIGRCRTAALAVIVTSARAAVIKLTTHAETGTVPGVRETLAPAGSPSAGPSCCPFPTSTSFSRCRRNSLPSRCCTICCSAPAQPRCLSLLVTRSIWEPTSGFSACSNLGPEPASPSAHSLHRSFWWPCNRLLQVDRFVATFLLAGRGPEPRVSRQVRCWVKQLVRQEKIQFRGSFQNLADPVPFRQFLRELFRNPGSCTQSRRSAVEALTASDNVDSRTATEQRDAVRSQLYETSLLPLPHAGD
jgi:hypothetical protein